MYKQYRAHDWINTNTGKPVFSIQARVGKNEWAHCHENGKPMFYDDAEKRDEKLKELNQ